MVCINNSAPYCYNEATDNKPKALVASEGLRVSGFRRDVDEISALLGYYAASCGNCLPTFRNNVSVPFSRFKNP